MTRKILIVCFSFALLLFASASGWGAGFPDKAVTLIVPFQAGGATDVVIRPLAEASRQAPGPARRHRK